MIWRKAHPAAFLWLFAVCAVPGLLQASESRIILQADKELRAVVNSLIADFRSIHKGVGVETHFLMAGVPQAESTSDAVIWLDKSTNSNAKLHAGIAGTPLMIARQQLAIWSTVRNVRHMTATNLLAPEFRRIAVASTGTPSGRAAKQALTRAGVWGPLHARLVFAETSEKAAELVRNGSADAGVLEIPLIMNAGLTSKGSFVPLSSANGILPKLLFGMTRRGARKPQVLDFTAFLTSPSAETILRRRGYAVPSR